MPTVSKTITADVDVEIEVEVYCNSCGDGLCNQTDVVTTRSRGESAFRVNACEKCLERAKAEGYDEGYAQAQKDLDNDLTKDGK